MNEAHIHLMANHIPVIGIVLGIIVLFYGIFRHSDTIKDAAYLIFVICGIGAIIAYSTGEGAEEAVKNISGVNTKIIGLHEDVALGTLISTIVLGVISLVSLFLSYKKSPLTNRAMYLILVVAFLSSGFALYTANLGGKIRHTELNQGSVISSPPNKTE